MSFGIEIIKAISRQKTLFFLLFILPCFPAKPVYGQEEDFIASKETASAFFESGNFTESLKHYKALSARFSKDPLYKYFSAACMVELGEDVDEAIYLLEEARNESSSLRPVPDKSLFYLALANQIENNFKKAIEYYDLFRDKIRKHEAREYKLDKRIEDCKIEDQRVEDQRVEDQKIKGQKIEDSKIEENRSVVYAGGDYDSIAQQGLEFQFLADSLTRVVSRYRKTLKQLGGSDRESINKLILDLETKIFNYQSEADKNFQKASSLNTELYDTISIENTAPETIVFKDSALISEPVQNDTIVITEDPEPVVEADTTGVESIEEKLVPEPDPIFTIFEDNVKMQGDIPVNDSLPEGLYYRIQVAAFRNPVKNSYFRSLSPVYGIRAADSDITFYFIGMFRRKADADKALVKVRTEGFKDAFVVAVFEAKRISLERSEVLEKEWFKISLFESDPRVKEKKPDEALTLVFRVEADRSEKEFKEDKIETLKLVAGKREFEIVRNEDDNYICLIGKFLTFESAQAYSDLLFRNGLKEAKVAAYLGNKEIPVETARDLFKLNNK